MGKGGRESKIKNESYLNGKNPLSLCNYKRLMTKNKISDSCFIESDLEKYAKKLNVNKSKYTQEDLLKMIRKLAGEKFNCKNDVCIANFLGDTKDIFKIYGPDNKYGWLSNFEIEDFMSQMEMIIPSFKFLGIGPRDWYNNFYFEYNNIKNKNLLEEYPGKKYFAVVFNTDWNSGSGEHWIGVFIEPGKTIEFVDSTGSTPYPEYMKFINEVAKNNNAKIKINKKQYQYKGSECGVFSIHFIVSRLAKISYEDYLKKPPTDDDVNHYRFIIFRNPHVSLQSKIDPIHNLLKKMK